MMGQMTATFGQLPPAAAWRHEDARQGFEVVFFEAVRAGLRLDGCTTAVEDGQASVVRYEIVVDEAWRTRSARVWERCPSGAREVRLDADASGCWRVDGVPMGHLNGCLDVDLESSACTNMLPVHRLALAVGEAVEAPAVYVRAHNLDVERLEQQYVRVEDDQTRPRFRYCAPRFDYDDHLVYDSSGLVLRYPGIATRVMNMM